MAEPETDLLTHTFPDGTTWTFVSETAKRMCVLEGDGIGNCKDIVCQWCKHMKMKPEAGFCARYEDKPSDVYFWSAPCEKFEDNGFGKAFSRNVLAETLPKDPQIRKILAEQLRKEFGHAVAVVGDQIFHLGRMGVYAANIYKWWIRPIESGNLGNHVLDEIANASPSIRDAWNCETNPKVLEIDRDKIGLEEFKLMPFICYAPSQVKQRANGVALGKKIGNRTHWALLTNGKTHVDAEYIGSTEA